jgi:hypothetical protein
MQDSNAPEILAEAYDYVDSPNIVHAAGWATPDASFSRPLSSILDQSAIGIVAQIDELFGVERNCGSAMDKPSGPSKKAV